MLEKVLKPKWQKRFDYFDEFYTQWDNLSVKEKRKMDKNMPFFVRFNWLAFFFGFIYFLILGLWRKGLVLVILSLIIQFSVGYGLEYLDTSPKMDERIMISLNMGIGLLFAYTANFAYYLHIKKGSTSWNPFEGMY